MMDDIRILSRFIRKVFTEEGNRLLEQQSQAIRSKVHERTGRLMRARNIWVYGGDGSSFDGMLTFTHTVYERFLDMKSIAGQRQKRRIIHNRYMMKAYGRIAYRLMNEFADEVQESLRKEIEEIRLRFR
ncbi:MAG: hypothetical protein IJ222_03375 [Bacteroidales bacterium]|nr:hypothetical protein [Bacteroidales bacterium]